MVAVLPWALFVSLSVAYGASVSPKESVAFEAKLLNHAVETPGRESGGPAASLVSADTPASSGGAVLAPKDAEDDLLGALPGAAYPDPPDADDGNDAFAVRTTFGYKRFLFAVFFLGGWIRFLTSAWYLKFLSEVFDPVEW